MFGKFHTKRWAGVFLVIGALVMAGAGLWFGAKAAALLDSGARASGTVIELRRSYGSKGLPLDHPVVRYTVPDTGRSVVFRSRVGMWPSPFSLGEAVEVIYDPANPQRADIDSFWTLWFPPVVILLFAALCFLAGRSTLRALKRTPPPPGP